MAIPVVHAEFATVTKRELHAWADALASCEPVAVQRCVDFVVAETKGLWHGRARALMCRRLKHCAMGRAHRSALVTCILERLESGQFSEQFKDQLRLALHLDPQRTLAVARKSLESDRAWVRRYAGWVLQLAQARDAP
jgi:hypothetical protein